MMDATTPVEIMPLVYQDRAVDPWRQMVRLMAGTTVAQGTLIVVPVLWMVGWDVVNRGFPIVFSGSLLDLMGTSIWLVQLCTGAGLVVGGWLACRLRPAGRRCITVLEPVMVLPALAQLGETLWRVHQFQIPSGVKIQSVVWGFLNLPMGLLLPTLLWLYFRRPEVRASFGEG